MRFRCDTYITLFQVGLLDDGLGDTGVLEDMLADILVHLEDIVGRLGVAGCGIVRLAMTGRAIALARLCLGHVGGERGSQSRIVVSSIGLHYYCGPWRFWRNR